MVGRPSRHAHPPPRRRAWEVAVVTTEPQGPDTAGRGLLLVVDGPTQQLLHAAILPSGMDPVPALWQLVRDPRCPRPRQLLVRDPDLADRLRPLGRCAWCLVRLVEHLPALEGIQAGLLGEPMRAWAAGRRADALVREAE